MLFTAIFILALLILSSLLSFFYPVGGTWERISEKNQSIWDRERAVLKQWGPLILGSQTVSGGIQKFFGFAFGPIVWLHRRDYGIQALINSGFPENIAKIVQGRVMLRMNLKLSADKLFLRGSATPFKVEFYPDSSEVKSIHTLEPTSRAYRRAELTPVSGSNQVPVNERAELSPL